MHGSLLKAVTFGFIVTLVIVKYILNLTRPATVKGARSRKFRQFQH